MNEFGVKLPGIHYVERPAAYGFLWDQDRLATVRTPMGLFLPGGGCDPGESFESALEREFLEEIGYQVVAQKRLGEATQYHWSDFYQSHFRKHGVFFLVEAQVVFGHSVQADHELIWLNRDQAALQLTQEFQRWAVAAMLPSP